ncbi:hypothetical protein QL285_013196 [Trifolium repens]|nr:hypothetical protein QL285_013196 [Trifolium repens]
MSETGSDADVSESCQVLLEIEAHGVGRKETQGCLKEIKYTECEMAGVIPNNLRNSLVLSNNIVNFEGDKGGYTNSVSEEPILRLEGGHVECSDGTRSGEVSPLGDSDVDKGGAAEVDRGKSGGPAQQSICGPFEDYVSDGGCKLPVGNLFGPKVLRTKNGDLNIAGPSITSRGEVKNQIFSAKVQNHTKRKQPMSVKHSMKAPRGEAGTNKKILHKGGIPELPLNKLRKFYGPLIHRNRSVRRKKASHISNSNGSDSASSSDSIHNSDISPSGQSARSHINHTEASEGFTLEVVLPCLLAAVEDRVPMANLANVEGSGMVNLLQSETVVARRSPDIVLEAPSRQVMEAKKIMSIQEEVGINVVGSKVEHLKRIMEMEERDQAEKEG